MSLPNSLLASSLLAVSTLVFGTGCASRNTRFVEPVPSENHAIALISSDVPVWNGEELHETAFVGGKSVTLANAQTTQRTAAVRLRPGNTAIELETRRFHVEERTSLESVPHVEGQIDPCERIDSRGRCISGWKNVTEWRLEPVTRPVVVEDERCGMAGAYALETGHTYRISLKFEGPLVCSLACLDVSERLEGTACVNAPPRTTKTAGTKRDGTYPRE